MNYRLSSISILLAASLLAGCKRERTINEEGNLVPKTVEFDKTLPAINVNGTTLHAETFGNPADPMLVILHGGPGSDYLYLLSNCKKFASEGYYVVFYDQRGSGLSKRHNWSSYSIQIMEDDLNAVINLYKTSPTQKIFLLGHSWGAILGTAYINRFPSAVNGFILAEPGGLVWQDIVDYVKRSRDYQFGGELMSDVTFIDQFIAARKRNDHALLDYKQGLLTVSDGSNDNPIGNEGHLAFWRQGAVVNSALFELAEKQKPNFTTNLSNYTTKVLFVYSERNKAYGEIHAKKVSAAFPNVQLFKVNGAGHDMISFSNGWNNFYPVALAYYNSLR